MQELDRRVGLLRLLLADLTARERQASEATEQLRTQLSRLADFTVRFNTSVATALTAMQEVDEGLEQQQRLLRHLALLRTRAQSELDALLVTRNVADARARLATLESRRIQLRAAASPTSPAHTTQGDQPPFSPSSLLSDLASPPSTPLLSPPPLTGSAPSNSQGSELIEIEAEIAELRAAIDAASDAAARSLAARETPQG